MISAVGVVIPARNEQDRITECLRSVRAALRQLPPATHRAVTVILDRCTDDTPARVAAALDDWPEAAAVHLGPGLAPAVTGAPARVENCRCGLGGGAVTGHVAALPVDGAASAVPPRDSAPVGVLAAAPGPAPTALAAPDPGPACPAASGVPSWRRPTGVGWIRDVGVRHLLGRLRGHAAETIWLLSTDADTRVPRDWATAHLWHAAGGAHGVAGLADLHAPARLSADVLERYEALVAEGLHDGWHDHVYAANLGFRADAYLAVGGFPVEGHGEEHGLWRRMAAAGYRLVAPTEVRVRTSARIRGRATGGLADLLRSMHRPAQGCGGA
ncbi:glycosyltransferase [Pseudonocardia acidicola]|uniref:Glycosyl transferase family 2 n=1 Tax=Pseudonocardia acidicola TaxID=2724939 RepID=A0ABX1S3L1_9PSEU|nr:hypothetical protein [Pseudonocardia acidicola]NMH96125.1 hypothetical protein [Pseudonocardia acidicola]